MAEELNDAEIKAEQEKIELEAQKAQEAEELGLLKERAKTLGLKFNNNLGLVKLKELVKTHLAGDKPEVKDDGKADFDIGTTKKDMIERTSKLIRISLESNDPKDRETKGVLICVSNDFVEYKKFIPYGVAWHVPQMIFDHLKECKFQKFRNKKVVNNNIPSVTTEAYYAKKYTIDKLEKLTQDELDTLGDDQRATNRV